MTRPLEKQALVHADVLITVDIRDIVYVYSQSKSFKEVNWSKFSARLSF